MGTRNAQDLPAAADLFKAGKFAEAENLYANVLLAAPDNVQVLTRLGGLALLANRLDDAQPWLDRAVEIKRLRSEGILQRLRRSLGLSAAYPPEALLAQVHYLRDDYRAAAPLFKIAGLTGQAAKLAEL